MRKAGRDVPVTKIQVMKPGMAKGGIVRGVRPKTVEVEVSVPLAPPMEREVVAGLVLQQALIEGWRIAVDPTHTDMLSKRVRQSRSPRHQQFSILTRVPHDNRLVDNIPHRCSQIRRLPYRRIPQMESLGRVSQRASGKPA